MLTIMEDRTHPFFLDGVILGSRIASTEPNSSAAMVTLAFRDESDPFI